MVSLMNICKLEGGALCYNPAEKYHLTLSAIELVFFLPILAPVFFCPQIQSWTLFLAASSYINLEKLTQTHHSYLPSIGWSSKLTRAHDKEAPLARYILEQKTTINIWSLEDIM